MTRPKRISGQLHPLQDVFAYGIKELGMPLSPPTPTTETRLRNQLRDASSPLWAVRVIVLFLVLVAAVLVLGPASSAWAADGCANAVLRAQNNSSRLPDCRAYELVSPPYKNGFKIVPQTFSDDGAVSFTSLGGLFAGVANGNPFTEYVATRSPAGWTTVAPVPSPLDYDSIVLPAVEGLSSDLGTTLWVTRRIVAPADDQLLYYLRGPDGSMTRVGPVAVPGLGGSAFTQATTPDMGHILFGHGSTGSGSASLAALYESVGIGNQGPARPVSVDNLGQQLPPEVCPVPGKAMSVDGRVIVFSSNCQGGGGGVRLLWARVGGSATVAVSGSECTRTSADPAGACNGVSPADFGGMGVDGSRVFFTTDQQLVNGDTDGSSDLYACEIPDGSPAPVGVTNPCSSLTKVSKTLGGTGSARVQGVAVVSDDGSRVYFTAQGVLADNLGTNGAAAVDGQDNLYLWTKDAAHPTGQMRFVTNLPEGGVSRAQTTADGRYLVFGSSSRLVTDGPGADTEGTCTPQAPSDCAADIYRYDAETRTMVRLSTGVSGSGGNTPGLDATLNVIDSPRYVQVQNSGNRRSVTAMSSDGSTVVFETAEALSVDDVDGVADVYAWHDGHMSLISDGVGGATSPWITPSGRDIYFFTTARLTSIDGDANGDIYDARVGGGFDLSRPVPCAGADCHGRPALVPDLPGASSSGATDPGVGGVVPAFSFAAVTPAQRQRLAATGKLTLTVKTNTPGTVTVTATVTGLSTVGSAHKTVSGPGTVRVTLSLSKKARVRLAAKGKLSLRLVVRHSQVALARSTTLRLTHTKTKKAKQSSSSLKLAGASGGRRS